MNVIVCLKCARAGIWHTGPTRADAKDGIEPDRRRVAATESTADAHGAWEVGTGPTLSACFLDALDRDKWFQDERQFAETLRVPGEIRSQTTEGDFEIFALVGDWQKPVIAFLALDQPEATLRLT